MQQQNPQPRRFGDTPQPQPVRRFQQQPIQGYEQQPSMQTPPVRTLHPTLQVPSAPAPRFAQPQPPAPAAPQEQPELTARQRRKLRKEQKKAKQQEQKQRKRTRSVIWFIFGVIGMLTVGVMLVRYAIIPLLVFLYSGTGGAL